MQVYRLHHTHIVSSEAAAVEMQQSACSAAMALTFQQHDYSIEIAVLRLQ